MVVNENDCIVAWSVYRLSSTFNKSVRFRPVKFAGQMTLLLKQVSVFGLSGRTTPYRCWSILVHI